VIEPDLANLDAPAGESQGFVDAHGMDPLSVLRMAKGMNAPLRRVVIVGCEPATLGGEAGAMGLSESVQASIGEAVLAVQSLVSRNLQALEAGS
jgi:hydrogenase maturation protease